jgi:RNA polymerase sigma factor (sigma-70 family)
MTFDELYAAYADNVYSFLRFKITDVYLVEDIFQDTFLTTYRELLRQRFPEHPKAWLITIAHRRMVDRLRDKSNREDSMETEKALQVHSNDDWTERIEVKELLDSLDDASRLLIYSIYVEGLTIREAAQYLGIPEGTVKRNDSKAIDISSLALLE